jgi:hypothetical protein
MAAPRNTFTGIMLIMIGGAFLLGQVTDIDFDWTFILMGLGLAFILKSVFERKPGSVFPGVLLLLLGLLFFSDNMGIDLFGVWDTWPFIPGVVGIAFLAEWAITREKNGLLFTAGILIVVSTLFVLAESRHMRWYTVGNILEWWPLALLAMGVYLLVKRPPKKVEKG